MIVGALLRKPMRALLDLHKLRGTNVVWTEQKGILESYFAIQIDDQCGKVSALLRDMAELER